MHESRCQPLGGPVLTRRGFLAAGPALLAAGCGGAPRDATRLPQAVRDFHRESLVFDLHVDTLLWQRTLGYDLARRHRPPLPFAAFLGHMDLPRAADGGLDGAVLGLVVSPREERPEQLLPLRVLARLEPGAGVEQSLETLGLLGESAREHPERLVFARTGSEVRRAAREGRFAALAGLEGGHGIEGRIDNLRRLHAAGLRMLGLVHFQSSAAAHPMTAPAFEGSGLTPFGFDLLAEMETLGVVLDLAHVNARGVEDALAALTRPFVVSHSGCRAVHDHPRNLSDAQLRSVADGGGVVGIAVGRSFLGPGGLDAFVRHVEHAARVAGPAAVAIGSDWDGAIIPARGLHDVTCLPFVSAALLERGWTPENTRALLGENAVRVLEDALG
jgi:membrane dipeptidase